MSSPGYPDDQERVMAHGEVALNDAGAALPNPPAGTTYGPFSVAHATALRVMVAPTGGNVTATLTWTMDGVTNAASGSTTLTFTGGTAISQLATCLGHLVTIKLVGSVNGVTADVWAVTSNPFSGNQPPFTAGVNDLTGLQNIPNLALTDVAWPSVDWDTNGFYSAGANTRLTIIQAGYYIVSATLAWAVNAVGIREVRLVNGATGEQVYDNKGATPAGFPTYHTIAHLFRCQSGHYLKTQAYQTSGGNLNCAVFPTAFVVVRVASL